MKKKMQGWRTAIAVVVPVAVIAAGLGLAPLPANALTQSVSVDVSSTGGAPSSVGRGFLYGLSNDGAAPSDALLQPIKPASFRGGGEIDVDGSWGWALGPSQFTPRYNVVKAQAQRVTNAPYNATYDVLVSDLWGSDGSGQRPANIAEPCDDGTACTNWVAFLTTLVNNLSADGLLNSKVRFDIWNEPAANSYFWPRTMSQYYTMWDVGVRTLRSLDPDAVIVGPSLANYDTTTMAGYLDHFTANNTMPNILNWHFSGNPVADANDARGLLAARSITGVALSMNEYLRSNQQTAGYTAWYLAQLQRSGISSASHAIWTNCCGEPSLDQVLINSLGSFQTSGAYWAYKASADLSGSVVASTGSADVDLTATRNDSSHTASMLLGGDGSFSGTLSAAVSGLGSTPYLNQSGSAHVIVQRLTDGLQSAPQTVQDAMLPISGNAVTVSIPWSSAMDAYTVTLTTGTPSGGSGGGTVAVDGNVTGGGTDQWSYGSGWGVTTGVGDMYAGTANWSSGAGQVATLHFTGTQVKLYAVHDTDQGIASVAIDGGTPVDVDGYSATRQAAALSWTSSTLSAGAHALTVTSTNRKNASSSGFTVAIDRADVVTSAAPTMTTVDADVTGTGTNQFDYSSGWGVTTGVGDLYAGTANWCPTAGRTASVAFTGTQIVLYAVRDVDQGRMTVSVDGGAATTVDDYAATRSASGSVWSSGTLVPGSHTLLVTVLGTKNAASSNTTIALDRVDITG